MARLRLTLALTALIATVLAADSQTSALFERSAKHQNRCAKKTEEGQEGVPAQDCGAAEALLGRAHRWRGLWSWGRPVG